MLENSCSVCVSMVHGLFIRYLLGMSAAGGDCGKFESMSPAKPAELNNSSHVAEESHIDEKLNSSLISVAYVRVSEKYKNAKKKREVYWT